MSFILFELLLWGLFLLAIFDSNKRWGQKSTLLFFIPLFVYGWVLEASAIGIFQRYEYGSGFLVTIFDAPLCIAAGWASITYSGLCIGKTLTNSHYKIALFTALWGLSIDFSMDGLAVLFGYWTWFAPEGVTLPYFNVPVSNFVGWFIILSFYSYFYLRWQDKKIRKLFIGFDAITPALPALLIAITLMIESEYERLFVSFPWWLMLLVFVLPNILILLYWLMNTDNLISKKNSVPFFINHSFHAFFLVASIVVALSSGDWRYFIAALVAALPALFILLKDKTKSTSMKNLKRAQIN